MNYFIYPINCNDNKQFLVINLLHFHLIDYCCSCSKNFDFRNCCHFDFQNCCYCCNFRNCCYFDFRSCYCCDFLCVHYSKPIQALQPSIIPQIFYHFFNPKKRYQDKFQKNDRFNDINSKYFQHNWQIHDRFICNLSRRYQDIRFGNDQIFDRLRI